MKILPALVKISWKTEIEPFPAVRYPKWKLEFVSNMLWMIVGPFMSYLCDQFFIFISIFIMINRIISKSYLEYVLLFSDDNVDKKCG